MKFSVNQPTIPLFESNPPPKGRGGITLNFVDNKILCFGGHYFAGDNKFEYLNETWILDIQTQIWYKIKCNGDIPSPRYGHSAHLIGSRLFVYGGRGKRGSLCRDIYVLFLDTWEWKVIQSPTVYPTSRFFHASETVGKKIVIHGGWNGSDVLDDLWIFDTDAYTWIQPATSGFSPSARYGHTLSLIPDGRLYLFGGCTLHKETKIPTYKNDSYSLDIQTMQWIRPSINGDAPTCRYGHSATVLVDGNIVIFGGYGTGGCQSREFINDPRVHSIVILDTKLMTWVIPEKSNKNALTHVYNHGACRAGKSSSVIVFGGFDGRQSMMEYFMIDIES